MFHFVRYLIRATRKVTTLARHILTWTNFFFWLSDALLTQIAVFWSCGHLEPLFCQESLSEILYLHTSLFSPMVSKGPALKHWNWDVSRLFLWLQSRLLESFRRVVLSNKESWKTQLACNTPIITLQVCTTRESSVAATTRWDMASCFPSQVTFINSFSGFILLPLCFQISSRLRLGST